MDIYDDMEGMDFTGKTFAVFGSGDTSYEHFCGAVDILEDKIKELGGNAVLPSVKIEMNPEDEEEDMLLQFGKDFAKKCEVPA